MRRTPGSLRSESHLVGLLLAEFERPEHAPCEVRKVHGSRFQRAGEPDLDACVRGRAVKVEAKMPGEVPTPIQYAVMRRWERAGALVGWVDSVAKLADLLTHVEDPEWVNPAICRHVAESGDDACARCGADVAA